MTLVGGLLGIADIRRIVRLSRAGFKYEYTSNEKRRLL